jgi:hypothetical protein
MVLTAKVAKKYAKGAKKAGEKRTVEVIALDCGLWTHGNGLFFLKKQ